MTGTSTKWKQVVSCYPDNPDYPTSPQNRTPHHGAPNTGTLSFRNDKVRRSSSPTNPQNQKSVRGNLSLRNDKVPPREPHLMPDLSAPRNPDLWPSFVDEQQQASRDRLQGRTGRLIAVRLAIVDTTICRACRCDDFRFRRSRGRALGATLYMSPTVCNAS
mgnify:CR=1 FL=1